MNNLPIQLNHSGKKIYLRANKIDLNVYESVFLHKQHQCPVSFNKSNPIIIDLGSNIGLTLIDFKIKYPSSSVLGIEMDSLNYEIAKKNISGFENIHLINKGVWINEGIIYYEGENAESFKIVDYETKQNVDGITLNKITESYLEVDYVKMDIEGAEHLIFQNNLEWLSKVKCISVEIHDTKDVSKEEGLKNISQILKNNGFHTFKNNSHWSSVVGYKD